MTSTRLTVVTRVAMSGRCATPHVWPGVASTSGPGRRRTGRTTCRAMRAGPTTPAPTYTNTWVDRFWLKQFHRQVAIELGEDPNSATGEYDATMRRCVKLVSTSKTSGEAQARGERVLRSLLPAGFAFGFKLFIASLPEWFVARHAAKVTPFLLPWLVGPSKVIDAPLNLPVDDTSEVPANAVYSALTKMKLEIAARQIWEMDPNKLSYAPVGDDTEKNKKTFPGNAVPGFQQGVLLQRCRVLEESRCASVCLNVCKLPTQKFFNETVGLAVTLVPDYETFECRFVYGKTPPPVELDEAFNTPCFSQCPITREGNGRKDFLLSGNKNDSATISDGDATKTNELDTALCDRLPFFVGE